MSTDDLKKDIDGVGRRITNVQVTQEGHRVKLEDQGQEINDLWRIVNEMRDEMKMITNSIAQHALSVSNRISTMEITLGKQIRNGIIAGVLLLAIPITLLILTNQNQIKQGVNKNEQRTNNSITGHQKYR